jgi:hypothetical protein
LDSTWSAAIGDAQRLLGGLDLLPIGRGVVEPAAVLAPDGMRSLDAIHLARALTVKESLTALVAYHVRRCSAATQAGLTVVSPGLIVPTLASG